MKQLFENSKSFWVRYSDYMVTEDQDGAKYMKSAPKAIPEMYFPTDDFDNIVVDALNVGRVCMGKDRPEEEKEEAIYQFVLKYGLLGLMTALPTTPRILSYENVYFNKNHFIKAESMSLDDYLNEFFPFEKPNIYKDGEEWKYEVEGDKYIAALMMMSDGRPTEVFITFQREYAERMDWLKQQFIDWAFTMMMVFFYYEDMDRLSDKGKEYYKQSLGAFDGITPTYHIELMDDGPLLVWNLNSLLQGIQLMVCNMLADSRNPVRMCRTCGKAFIAKRYRDKFCSKECKEINEDYYSN